MATTIQRYVNTGSTAGGDGTTNNTIGSTRAFASLSEWDTAMAARGKGIVAADETHIVDCCGATADSAGVTVSGWTTNATHRVLIQGNASHANGRHAGVWSTSKYRLSVVGTDTTPCLYVNDDDIDVLGIQLNPLGNGNYANMGFNTGTGVTSANTGKWKELVIKNSASLSATSGNPTGAVLKSNSSVPMYFANSIIYDFKRNDGSGRGIDHNYPDVYLYNVTVQNCAIGVNGENSYIRAKNVIAQDCTNGFNGSFHAVSNYNISDIAADAPGANSKQATVSFLDKANDNFHLADGDTAAKGWGLNLTADANFPFTDDIDGETRPASGLWCAGADENFAGGTNQPMALRNSGVPFVKDCSWRQRNLNL